MSQQPFQAWQSQQGNYYREESVQQQHPASTTYQPMPQEYIEGSNQYLLYQDLTNSQNRLQAGPQSRQDQSSLSLSQLPIGSIQQQNGALFPQRNPPTHRQQRQQRWLSQYPYSRQLEVQTPKQSEHQLDRQNSVQDMVGVFPIELSDYAQLQVYPTEIIQRPSPTQASNQQVPQQSVDQSGNDGNL
ncbi:10002_t:CDS:2 [Paraglomus brasilianum]|uniref:10002_t:CDS:1 n=1 Tax=Paraglomus brasilianum TaxID=144538 RepID=A0A9N9FG38_9GLOM|nr:10002_t:CDS:2 [Paraglomus brasilianum]